MDPKPLWIELLGRFRIRVGDEDVPAEVWRRRKVRSLVKLLALAHGYRLHREQVMELLWPDAGLQAALNSLHQTLYLARRSLDPGSSARTRFLLLQDEIVTLGPPDLIWVDVVAFEAAAAQARQSQDPAAYWAALELYRGELLPEDRYEEWASTRREALHQEYLALLRELSRLAEARADYGLAIETLHKALAADPAHEEVHRDLMRLYALTGARQQALRQYQALQEVLRQELDLEPDTHSQRLYQAILAGQLSPSSPAQEAPAGAVLARSPSVAASVATGRTEQLHGGALLAPRSGQHLPTGTVTFLCTEIADSTKLWERHPEAMHQALARHDTILRHAIDAHGGLVFKTAGDSVHAAFASAPSALAAALAAQQALAGEAWEVTGPLSVRMALHTGTAEERDGDYFGPPLNRVARLLAAGHGGQILLSRATQELVREELPPGSALRDLGVHQFKDLRDPEQIFQLITPGLPTDFPPLKSLGTLHNLPVQITSFIGREREIAEVQQLLTTTHLLTLAGSGGCGKTRLALAVAAEALHAYPDGVWLVDLAALADPALVPQAVAAALGLREAPGQPLTETLAAYLQPKQLLLVLDNCEHLVVACAHLVETLLRACPQLRILATSRETLHIPGEVTWLVPSLSLPDPRRLPSLPQLLRYEAIRLFVDRALAVLPTFRVTEQNAPAIAQICMRLDGVPLAIELAAARMPVLTVEQLAARLDDCFRLLTGGSRTALTRHQTLKATLDWSYDLLTGREQALLRRLAVFAGGFTLEAAEAICGGAGLEPRDLLDLLSRLVAKSLVVAEQQGPLARYRLLETVRQYSAAKLRDTDEETTVRARHLDWYLALATHADPHLRGPHQEQWLYSLKQERDNLRAALEWCLGSKRQEPRTEEPRTADHEHSNRSQRTIDSGQLIMGLRLARALAWFWYLDGSLSEGRAWFERALARTDETERTWARAIALYGAGRMALPQDDLTTARSRLEASSAILRELGEPHDLAMAWFILSVVAVNQGDDHAALSYLHESLELFRAVGDQEYYALSLMHMGDVALRRGEWTAARTCYEEALSIHRQLGGRWGVAQLLNNLGEVARCEGDYRRAAQLYEESLAAFRELGSSGDIARSIHNLGYVAHAQGNDHQARACFTESLRLFQERGSKRGIIECIAGLAGVVGAQEQLERAARLLGATVAQFEAIGAAMWSADQIEYQRNVATIRALLGEEAFAAAWAEGRTLTLEQAIAEAFSDEK